MVATATGAVALFLGLFGPPSSVHLTSNYHSTYHSVGYYDLLIDLTNNVLDRSVSTGIVRDASNASTGEFHLNLALLQKQAVEEHCKRRLEAEGIPNPAQECGPGFTRN